MQKKLISILMPVYNSYDFVRSEGKNLLETALKSILNQSYTNFELIILDNQSTDKTPTVCKDYARKDHRVKYIRDTKKRYPEGAITHLATLAQGDYCMIANDDDVWNKSYISTLMAYLKEHAETDLCYANGQFIDIKNNILGQLIPNYRYVYSSEKSSYANFIKFLYLRNVVPIAFGIYRIKAFRQTLPYYKFDNLKANVDNLFMMKFFLQNHGIHFIDRDLFYYRSKERALNPSKTSDMPPLTHPVDIWNYYGVHQMNFHLQILKLINKNVGNPLPKTLATIESLASCVNATMNLLNWIEADVADNLGDREKFFEAIMSWKHHVNRQVEPMYENLPFNNLVELSGQSPIINSKVNSLLKDLATFKNIVRELNRRNGNKYSAFRSKFLKLIEKEAGRVSAISQTIKSDNKTSEILTSFPKKTISQNIRPKISVIVTSYNLKKFLKPTLYSILNQRFDNYEIIVIDGKSTDGSVKELTKLEEIFSQVHCVFEKDNGYSDALWKGIKLARGKYIMQCAVSDAYANPDWLTICTNTLDAHKDISLIWGFPQYINEQAQVGKISYPEFHTRAAPSGKDFYKYWLKTGFFFPEGNLCVRKKVLVKCYPAASEITPLTLDWLEFSYRFNRYGYLAMHIPVVANYGRRHKSQMGTYLEKSGQLKRISIYYFGKLTIYRMMLFTGIVKHKFVDQFGRVVKDKKYKKLHFYPLRGRLIPLPVSKLNKYTRRMIMFTMYYTKHIL